MSRLSLATLFAGLLASGAMAQEDSDGFRVGTHVFRKLLHARKLKPLENWKAFLERDPANTILILLGSRIDSQNVRGGLKRFVDDGGALLIATDMAVHDPQFGPLVGYYPRGTRVSAWPPGGGQFQAPDRVDSRVDDRFIYRGREAGLRDCIVVDPTLQGGPDLFWNSLVGKREQALRVVANRSGTLWPMNEDNDPEGSHVLARFPPGCWYSDARWLHRQFLRPAFAVSRDTGAGRVLMLADHSVFINEMVLQEDNGNLDFTFKTIEWLRDEKRTHVLFVDNGQIQKQFDVKFGEELTLRDLQPDIVDWLNESTMKLQEQNRHEAHLDNALVAGLSEVPGRAIFGRSGLQNFYLLVILLAALGLGIWGMVRLARASHRVEPGVPLFAAVAGRMRPPVSPLALRQRVALSTDDLRDFAHAAAADFFHGLPGCPDEWKGPPRIEVHGGRFHAGQVRQEVLELWRLAMEEATERMSHVDFRKLLSRIDRLKAGLERGDVRISWNT